MNRCDANCSFQSELHIGASHFRVVIRPERRPPIFQNATTARVSSLPPVGVIRPLDVRRLAGPISAVTHPSDCRHTSIWKSLLTYAQLLTTGQRFAPGTAAAQLQ
jgi:hypothetical protein